MSRRGSLLVLALLLAPAALAAQVTVDFYIPDSALTILTNRTGTAELRVYNAAGISAYNITIFLDDSRVQLVGADTVFAYQLAPPTITTGTEQITLQASGPGINSSTMILAKLTFHLDTLAQLGSLLSIRVNSLVDFLGSDVTPGHRTGLLNLCQAEQIGGDVSGDRKVNSRDALAVLTAAVGLAVPGAFDVGRPADVDRDLQATSRDALFILGYGIGITDIYSAPLLGAWLTNKCAPLAPAPNDMAFWRSAKLYKIPASDTIPTALGVAGIDTYYARWSPNGSKLVFTASTVAYGYEVMLMNADGTGLDTLSLNTSSDFAPDWSPDSSKIAFVSSRVSPQSIFTMKPDGTGQAQLTGTYTVYEVAWSPDGRRLAFTGCGGVCSTRGLWTVNSDGTNVAEVFAGSDAHAPQDPVWSPSGDSLIYYSWSRGLVYKVAATGDTVAASTLSGGQDSPWWANTAHTFRSFIRSTYDFFLRRISDGRHLRLTADPGSNDVRASVRRTLTAPPAAYPDTVIVTPDSILLLPDSVDTLTVVVKDNTGKPIVSPVSWHSRDTTVAKVNNAGIVTATPNAGVTYVVATSGWRSDSTKVVVAVTLGSVTVGGAHACGLTTIGRAYCWGRNAYGQLGTGTTVNSTHPMRVTGAVAFASITAGLEHTCAVDSAGAAYCWGQNSQGQLGNGTTTQQTTPVAVTGGLTFASVEAGYQFTCGVTTTTNVGYCWGDNFYGQLGDNTGLDQSAPSVVSGALPWASLSAGNLHACGVTTGGVAYCWGYDGNHRLGDDSTVTNRAVPTVVYGGRTWSSVSAFDLHTCGVEASTNAAFCWGYNGYGEIGDGSTVERFVPFAVSGALSFQAVTTGLYHTCGVVSVNTPYCWGANYSGQVGDGTTLTRTAPVLVSGGLLFAAMSAGQEFSCGITPPGASAPVVYCWGYNGDGRLGDGTFVNRTAPVRVVGQQ